MYVCNLVTADLKQPGRQHAISHALNKRSAGQIEGECNTGVSRDQYGIRKETVKGGSRSVFDKYEVKGHSSELGER